MKLMTLLLIALSIWTYALPSFAFLPSQVEVVTPTQSHPVGRLYVEGMKKRGVHVEQKDLHIYFTTPQGEQKHIVLALQEYSLLSKPDVAPDKGVLFGHGWTGNHVNWDNYVMLALESGLKPVTVIWPGHGLPLEPARSGAFRSFYVQPKMGDYGPYAWAEPVTQALNDYMRKAFLQYAYFGHSMGGMIGTAMNAKGFLMPDQMVSLGDPNNFDDRPEFLESPAQLARFVNSLRNPDKIHYTLGHVPDPDGKLIERLPLALKLTGMERKILNNPSHLYLNAGPFSNDYLEWFGRISAEAYDWSGLKLQSDIIFSKGKQEFIGREALDDTWDERASEVHMTKLLVNGAGHFLEVGSQKYAEHVWDLFMNSFVHDNRPPNGTLIQASTLPWQQGSMCSKFFF